MTNSYHPFLSTYAVTQAQVWGNIPPCLHGLKDHAKCLSVDSKKTHAVQSRITKGELLMNKTRRNTLCSCGSGKKLENCSFRKGFVLILILTALSTARLLALAETNAVSFVPETVNNREDILFNSPTASQDPELLDGCCLVQLKGKLLLETFAGPPNYENVAEGDIPETRWILELDPCFSDYLWSVPIPSFYKTSFIENRTDVDWIQLTISPLNEKVLKFKDQNVIIEGFLGGWHTHMHAPFLLEVTKISCEQ